MRTASEAASNARQDLLRTDAERQKAESDAEKLSSKLQLVHEELAVQRAQPVFQGNSPSGFAELTQT